MKWNQVVCESSVWSPDVRQLPERLPISCEKTEENVTCLAQNPGLRTWETQYKAHDWQEQPTNDLILILLSRWELPRPQILAQELNSVEMGTKKRWNSLIDELTLHNHDQKVVVLPADLSFTPAS